MRFIASDKFERAYSRLDGSVADAVGKALCLMGQDINHPSLRVKRVRGTPDVWESSASRSIRITFVYLADDLIQLKNVGTHDQVFRPPY